VPLADIKLWLFGIGCAVLLNMPFGISLIIIGHVPVSTYSIITSTTPLFGYGLALTIGMERFSWTRAAAIATGFIGAAILVIEPTALSGGTLFSVLDPWLLGSLSLPFFYALYHLFASHYWPKGRDAGAVSVVESLASGFVFLPALLLVDAQSTIELPLPAWLALGAVTLMWVIERITFFNLVRHFGPVSTVQAVNVATVGAVALGALIYSEPVDGRLIISGILVLTAVWLNSRAEKHRKSLVEAT
jgi:drug/metabolite transporter (DMT)-like permease